LIISAHFKTASESLSEGKVKKDQFRRYDMRIEQPHISANTARDSGKLIAGYTKRDEEYRTEKLMPDKMAPLPPLTSAFSVFQFFCPTSFCFVLPD